MDSTIPLTDRSQIVLIIESQNQFAECIAEITRNKRFQRRNQSKEPPPTEQMTSSRETTPKLPWNQTSWEIRLDEPPCRKGEWVFGSSSDPQKCDFQLAVDKSTGVSGQQFKIFHSRESCILSITNISINGTRIIHGEGRKDLRDTMPVPVEQPLIIRVGLLQIQLSIPSRTREEETKHQRHLSQFLDKLHGQEDQVLVSESQNPTPAVVPFKKNLELEYIEEVGQGSFGIVHTAIDSISGKIVAVKKIDKRFVRSRRRQNGDKSLANEMKLAFKLRHENIVSFIAVDDKDDNTLIIIMEYIKLGDLYQHIQSGRFTHKDVHTVAEQQCSALQYLHRMDVTHRDIKPGNILVDSRNPLVTKLSDFGESSLSPPLTTFTGTIAYQAPELKTIEDGHTYTSKVDVWSLGLVLVQLLEPDVALKYLYLLPERCSGTLAELCQTMLVVEPDKRATAHECFDFIRANPTASWINEGGASYIPESSQNTEKKRNIDTSSSTHTKDLKRNKLRTIEST